MRVVIGYESMYGNTRRIAEAIAAGISPDDQVTVQPVNELDQTSLSADVLVIGAPTHAHSLPRPSSRRAAMEAADKRNDGTDVEPSATGPGVREWLERLPSFVSVQIAAFDTRFRPPAWLVGHPARKVSRTLARRGAPVLSRPQSFFVDKQERLRPGEIERARRWGEELRRAAARPTQLVAG